MTTIKKLIVVWVEIGTHDSLIIILYCGLISYNILPICCCHGNEVVWTYPLPPAKSWGTIAPPPPLPSSQVHDKAITSVKSVCRSMIELELGVMLSLKSEVSFNGVFRVKTGHINAHLCLKVNRSSCLKEHLHNPIVPLLTCTKERSVSILCVHEESNNLVSNMHMHWKTELMS